MYKLKVYGHAEELLAHRFTTGGGIIELID